MALDHPIPNAKKYVFFPIPEKKHPKLTKKCIFFLFSIFISYNTNTEHIGKFNYWNKSSNGNVIHKDDVKFPNFSQNDANFPNSMGPNPIPKKGCESPALLSTE